MFILALRMFLYQHYVFYFIKAKNKIRLKKLLCKWMLQCIVLYMVNTDLLMPFDHFILTVLDIFWLFASFMWTSKWIVRFNSMFCWCQTWVIFVLLIFCWEVLVPWFAVCTSFTPTNGKVTTMSGNVVGSTLTIRCNQGYYINGSSTLTCGSEAQWTPSSSCLIYGMILMCKKKLVL